MLCNCPISGIRWHADYMTTQGAQVSCHPIFYLTQRELYQLAIKDFWVSRYNKMDNYLITLALLNSTSLVEWHAPATPTKDAHMRALRQLPALLDIIDAMNACERLPAALRPTFPRIVINQENNNLSCLSTHIEVWQTVILETRANIKDVRSENELRISESRFMAALYDANINGRRLGIIASRWLTATLDWHPVADMLWRKMIITAASASKYNNDDNRLKIANYYTIGDWEQLENYLMDNLEHGTTFSAILMQWIAIAKTTIQAQYARGQSVDINGNLTIDRAIDSPENNAILRLIDDSPTAQPLPAEYKSKLDYLKALAKYNAAKNYAVINAPKDNIL